MCFGLVFFMFQLLDFLELLGSVGLWFSSYLEILQALFLKIFYQSHSLFSFRNFSCTCIWLLEIAPQFTDVPFIVLNSSSSSDNREKKNLCHLLLWYKLNFWRQLSGSLLHISLPIPQFPLLFFAGDVLQILQCLGLASPDIWQLVNIRLKIHHLNCSDGSALNINMANIYGGLTL